MQPRILSLFSGYGGLDMAVQEVFGGDLVAVADIDSGPCKILAHRHPDVPNLGNVSAVDWTTIHADIICGGSPCQDLSTAGRRAGMTDGTRSNLWVMMREAISHIRPQRVVWENVRCAYSARADSAMESDPRLLGDHPAGIPALRALGRVLGDLADLGYDAQWCGLRAADVGAPHGRFRVFLLAADSRGDGGHEGDVAIVGRTRGAGATGLPVERHRLATANADQPGLEGQQGQAGAAQAGRHGHALAGAGGPDLTLLPTPRSSDTNGAGVHGKGGLDLRSAIDLLPTPTSERPDARKSDAFAAGRGTFFDIVENDKWGKYAGAIARWEAIHGPSPAPTMTSPRSGNRQLSPAFTEWMMGLPTGWITDVPGITRNEALKACGNGVVPAQAAAALRFMLTRQEAVT